MSDDGTGQSNLLRTFADVKRLPVGTELYCVRNHAGNCRLYRKLEKVQTNAWAFSGDGVEAGRLAWTHFPKSARLVECNGHGVRFYYDESKTRCIAYELKEDHENP